MAESTDEVASPKVDPTSEPESPPSAPLELRRGTKLELGYRRGTVQCVRGGWSKPYDVRVHWDHEKYPQWITFRTLELDHEHGKLRVLAR